MFGFGKKKTDTPVWGDLSQAIPVAPGAQIVSVDDLPRPMAVHQSHQSNFRNTLFDGSKFPGGFGPTHFLWTDYWTLRARSAQLFKENLYARGLIRRLVVNEINTGLHLEATPEESVLGRDQDSLAAWSELTENRFAVWGKTARLCDHKERLSFGGLQATARMEALVSGDVLVVMQQDQRTRLPRLRLINGAAVMNPIDRSPLKNGNRIVHGVEIDKAGRQVAYWIRQDPTLSGIDSLKSRCLPAFGEKSELRLAWLVYGTDKRENDVRGEPMLSLILQSLKDLDRYRDATIRKAVVNSFLAMFIKKTTDKPGTRPMAGGAIRRGTDTTVDTTGDERTFEVAEFIPGMIIEELQEGEEPVPVGSTGTDEKFGDFEEAIIQGVAWANNVPPEILRLSFSNNYSASQAAINEFKLYLNAIRTSFGEQFCQPVYTEWLLSEVLRQSVEAPGLLEAFRTPAQYGDFAAWVSSDWAGHVKPAVDLSKLVKGYGAMIGMGLITRDRAARELTGTKYSKNIAKLKLENLQWVEAMRPVLELENPPAPEAAPAEAEPRDIDDESDVNDDERDTG